MWVPDRGREVDVHVTHLGEALNRLQPAHTPWHGDVEQDRVEAIFAKGPLVQIDRALAVVRDLHGVAELLE